ncbi:LysR family transcriptional regulator [Orenia metallireducens]|uniref:LysR family transcriptional regulator n=1 Tax=Orenia metallireducens TaxID=1413210 RepID=UPI0009F497C6|nr:LysR family transcriptional regulator [Orenia metallireducens]
MNLNYKINLREIKIFATVCKTNSMSEAARQLYMTQPAVSQTIIDLEEKLQVKLFERMNKRLVLTHAGEILLKYSKRIILIMDEAENTLEDIANLKVGKLRVGASMTIGTYLLPLIIKEFNKKYPEINLNLVIDNTSVIEEKILNNDIDIGLVEGLIGAKDIFFDSFYHDKLFLVCSKDNPLTQKKTIDREDIENQHFISREEGSGTKEIIDKIMNAYNINYQIKHTLNNIEAIKKSIKNNLGISILPDIAIQEELLKGELIKLNLRDIQFQRSFNLIYHKDKNLTNLLKQFIDHIKGYPIIK